MNLFISLTSLVLLYRCSAQDYASPSYNSDYNAANPTNDYNTNDPRYDNPYDPNRRYQNTDLNRNPYATDQRYNQYENRNNPLVPNIYSENTPRPAWDVGRTFTSNVRAELEHDSVLINEATYFIVASRMVRPGQIYKISANILRARLQMTVRASVSCNGVEIGHSIERVKEGVPEILNVRIPETTVPGDYKLRVEGLYLDDPFGGRAFVNETQLTFSQRFMTIFIQMDKPVYKQGQTVRFRVIPINTELKAFGRAIDVYILDPNRRIMKRWLSRQHYIHGRVMANYTSGAPVRGNLTLRATIRPVPHYRPRQDLEQRDRVVRVRPRGVQPAQHELPARAAQPAGPPRLVDEKFPFWMPKPEPVEFANQNMNNINNYNSYTTSTNYNYYNNHYYDKLPYLRFFNGTYEFKYPMAELAQLVPTLDGMEVIVTASVGDPLLDEVQEAYSIARIYNSSLALTFLGGELQVFKPAMPFDVYMVVSYHDGARLPRWQAAGVSLTVNVQVEGRGGNMEPLRPTLVAGQDAVWHLKIDLYKMLRLDKDPNYREVLSGVSGVRLQAQLTDAVGGRAAADLHLVISKMSRFDEATNGTFAYTWRSHYGDPDELVYAGLVVFSDVSVTRRHSVCNASLGLSECLDGNCYPTDKRCDRVYDCSDHTDEVGCEHDDSLELSHFRKFRFSRVQRQYDNVWLWRDVNIGPHGRYVFTVDVPQVAAHWTVSAFSMAPTGGLGMLPAIH
ncbi:unnamed protein product, partial [Leptidea sinapis]